MRTNANWCKQVQRINQDWANSYHRNWFAAKRLLQTDWQVVADIALQLASSVNTCCSITTSAAIACRYMALMQQLCRLSVSDRYRMTQAMKRLARQRRSCSNRLNIRWWIFAGRKIRYKVIVFDVRHRLVVKWVLLWLGFIIFIDQHDIGAGYQSDVAQH